MMRYNWMATKWRLATIYCWELTTLRFHLMSYVVMIHNWLQVFILSPLRVINYHVNCLFSTFPVFTLKICWWQMWNLRDKAGHQHPLGINIGCRAPTSKRCNQDLILSPTSKNCHYNFCCIFVSSEVIYWKND